MQEDQAPGDGIGYIMTAVVVCPDAMFSRMMALSLSARGVEAFECHIYGDALSKKPDCVFVDAALFDSSKKPDDGCDVVIFGRRDALASLDDAGDCAVYERPFDVEELLDTVVGKAAVGKDVPKNKKHAYDGLRLYNSTHSATYRGEHISLSKKEFALLALLLENKGAVVSRENALKNVFGDDGDARSNVVDVYVKYLREKIDERFDIKLITSVRSKGYTIKTE